MVQYYFLVLLSSSLCNFPEHCLMFPHMLVLASAFCSVCVIFTPYMISCIFTKFNFSKTIFLLLPLDIFYDPLHLKTFLVVLHRFYMSHTTLDRSPTRSSVSVCDCNCNDLIKFPFKVHIKLASSWYWSIFHASALPFFLPAFSSSTRNLDGLLSLLYSFLY